MSNSGIPTSQDSTAVQACDCKIGRICSQYEMSDILSELGTRWATEEGTSLRQLADDFNIQVLQTAMREAGLNPLDGEVDNLYRLLTADDVSAGSRVQARNRLEKRGIDPDDLQSEFVSYQTINRHLKQCLDIQDKQSDQTTPLTKEKARRRIRALQNRTTAVTENTLNQLNQRDELDLTDFDVLVDISVICNECGTHRPLSQLLDAGACDCE